MKHNLVIFILFGFLIACSSNADKNKSGDSKIEVSGLIGDNIDTLNVISGNELPKLLEMKDSVWVSMKSEIIANCKNSGCWMDLDLGNGETIKVTFKDYAFFIPLDSEGKTAIVEGFAKKELIAVDMLKHYAQDEGKSMEEIEAITEPELSYMFEAIGVVIEE